MFVKDIIKDKDIRKFLLENFPKPSTNHLEIFPEIALTGNTNPSLTGYAFEFFVYLLSIKQKEDFENNLQSKKQTAFSNISRTLNQKENENCKGHIRFYLNKAVYETKVNHIKKILSKKSILLNEASNKFKYVIIENVADYKTSERIYEKTNLLVAGKQLEIFWHNALETIWGGAPQYTIVIDKDSLANFITEALKKFEINCESFLQNKILTKDFMESLLEFTQISSQYFGTNVIDGLHFKTTYLDYFFELCNNFYQRKGFQLNELLYKPSLQCFKILATPDFLVKNKILEIKTSKEFFSTDDYLQCLVYLLLSQTSENKKSWGSIKEIEIFYAVYGKSVTLKLDHLQQKTSPAIKFLASYSEKNIKNQKERLKNLKLQTKKRK